MRFQPETTKAAQLRRQQIDILLKEYFYKPSLNINNYYANYNT